MAATSVEKVATTLPHELQSIFQEPDSKFIAIKVAADLDWITALEGSKLHFSEAEVTLDAPNSTETLSIQVPENRWSQLLCLAPEKQGSHKLNVNGAVKAVIELVRSSNALVAAEGIAKRTDSILASLKATREEAKQAERSAGAKQRAQTRKRCNIASLRTGLSGVGWPIDEEMESIFTEDVWDGSGEPPEQRGAAQSSSSSGPNLQEFGSLKVKAIGSSADGRCVPVAFWGMGNLEADGHKGISFKRYGHSKKKTGTLKNLHLRGKSLNASELKLSGVLVKPKPPFGKTTLIGALQPGSKKLLLFQGEVYHVHIDRTAADPEDPDAEAEEPAEEAMPQTAKGYRDKRKTAIESFGAAKKLRSFTAVAERLDREPEVIELEKYKEGIAQRVKEEKEKKVTVEQRDLETKRSVLPTFDMDAKEPHLIYAEGLESIAQKEDIEADEFLATDQSDLVKMVERSHEELRKMTAADAAEKCKTHMAYAVLKARAAQNAPPPQDLAMFARKLAVLNILVAIVSRGAKFKGGKLTYKKLAGMLDVKDESSCPVLQHLHDYCYDPGVGNKYVRTFNSRKTMCALLVWALHLSPELYLDITKDTEVELHFDRADITRVCEYIGCRIDVKKGEGFRATLKEPPKFNSHVYESQSKAPKAKSK